MGASRDWDAARRGRPRIEALFSSQSMPLADAGKTDESFDIFPFQFADRRQGDPPGPPGQTLDFAPIRVEGVFAPNRRFVRKGRRPIHLLGTT